MDGLVTDGLILFGGPIADGQQTLHVVEARDEDQVRRCSQRIRGPGPGR